MNRVHCASIVTSAFALLLSAGAANALTVSSTSTTGVLPVANNDLIEGRIPVIAGGIEDRESLNSNTSGSALTNGTFGPAGLTNGPGPNPELTIIDNNLSLTYAFSVAANITDINTYSGWRDTGRVNQNYTVSYTTVTDPVFQSLVTVNESYSGGNPAGLGVFISDINLTNVTAVRFSFSGVQNGFVGFKELDVIGTFVPEPATATLGLLAIGGLMLRRRRMA